VNAPKKKKNEPTYSFDLDAVFPNLIAKETADEVVNQRELSTMLEECLDMVGSKYKEPLVLYYFEEMSYSETAEILHIPESTVGVRLRRGRMALKDAYDKLEGNNVS
jgi:RNA polymerase sigma-70 factor (ECF subfamily)